MLISSSAVSRGSLPLKGEVSLSICHPSWRPRGRPPLPWACPLPVSFFLVCKFLPAGRGAFVLESLAFTKNATLSLDRTFFPSRTEELPSVSSFFPAKRRRPFPPLQAEILSSCNPQREVPHRHECLISVVFLVRGGKRPLPSQGWDFSILGLPFLCRARSSLPVEAECSAKDWPGFRPLPSPRECFS